VPLLECVVNFLNWTGAPIAAAIRAVTETPAEMLGIQAIKGSLKPGADADLVVLSESTAADGKIALVVDEVWKFGERVAFHS
jgi:N-acetylglucosamine-6-phosphate deacetylase